MKVLEEDIEENDGEDKNGNEEENDYKNGSWR